jgi:hypothetical protein
MLKLNNLARGANSLKLSSHLPTITRAGTETKTRGAENQLS